jgi:hypothetical protein
MGLQGACGSLVDFHQGARFSCTSSLFVLQLSHLAVVYAELSDETHYTTPSDKDIHYADATVLSAASGDHKLRVWKEPLIQQCKRLNGGSKISISHVRYDKHYGTLGTTPM